MAHKPLADEELHEAFRLIRDHSAILVHPLLDQLEKLLLQERTDRRELSVRHGVGELLRVLKTPVPSHAPVAVDELADNDRWAIRVDLDLSRDIARGK